MFWVGHVEKCEVKRPWAVCRVLKREEVDGAGSAIGFIPVYAERIDAETSFPRHLYERLTVREIKRIEEGTRNVKTR